MAKEYIERTEEIILAVNAGARAIENTKRYHGAYYTTTRFSGKRKDISYLQAAEVLRSVDNIPAADVVEVVHGRWIPIEYDGYADGNPVWDLWECSECQEEHSGDEDTLTPFCPNCGAKMNKEA